MRSGTTEQGGRVVLVVVNDSSLRTHQPEFRRVLKKCYRFINGV